METKFNFKSAICTSREQSERLLALGLKKETRDAVLKKYIHSDKYCYKPVFEDIEDRLIDCNDLYPAWSMGRLIEIIPENCDDINYEFRSAALTLMSKQNGNLYDFLIGFISQCIKMGYFPKEYLNGTTED